MSDQLALELDRIAERVALLVRVVHALREENETLRASNERSGGENRRLLERLETARDRIDALVARIPAEP